MSQPENERTIEGQFKKLTEACASSKLDHELGELAVLLMMLDQVLDQSSVQKTREAVRDKLVAFKRESRENGFSDATISPVHILLTLIEEQITTEEEKMRLFFIIQGTRFSVHEKISQRHSSRQSPNS